MADIDAIPWGDCRPGTYLDSPGGAAEVAIVGLHPYTVRAAALGVSGGVNNPSMRLCAMALDAGNNPVTAASGRYLRLWNNESKTFYQLDGSNRYKLLSSSDTADVRHGMSNPPDFCSMGGSIFMGDGRPRNDPPGFYNMLRLCVRQTSNAFYITEYDSLSTSRPVSTTFTITAVNDAICFGSPGKFTGLVIRIGTSGIGTWTVTWEYWNGTTWSSLAGVTDNTTGFTAATGNQTVSFTEPSDWIGTKVNALPISGNLFWVRARISAFTSTTINPILTSYEVTGNDVISGAVADDGGVTTDQTILAQTQTVNDLTLLPAVPVVNDAYYFGATNTWRSLLLDIGTAGSGTWTVTWEYWNGSAWTALAGVTDNTNGFRKAGFQTVLFTLPSAWATTTVGGIASKYWIRGRVSAFTSVTTAPTGNQAWVFSGSRSTSFSSVAIQVGDDPANAAPVVIGWGVDPYDNLAPAVSRLTTGGSAGSSYIEIRPYDSARDREGPGTVILVTNSGVSTITLTVGDHNQVAVGAIRLYLESSAGVGSANAARYRVTFPDGKDYLALGSQTTWTIAGGIANAAAPTAGSDVANGPVVDSDYLPSKAGTFASCAAGRTRVVAAGSPARDVATTTRRDGFENEIVWSSVNKPHYFPAANRSRISANDGDEIVAVRELFDKFYVFKRRSIHAVSLDSIGGNPPTIVQVSVGIGCQAMRTIVRAGNALVFLGPEGVYSLDGAGQLSKLPLSDPVQKILQSLDGDAMTNSCAAWWPEMQCYLLAVPGLQAQVTGGAGPSATSGLSGVTGPINDGMLVCHLPTVTWDIHPGLYAGSLATMWRTSSSYEVWMGDYFGRVWRSDETANVDGQVVSGITYAGTYNSATPHSTVITDTLATFLASATDKRLIGSYVWIYDGAGQGQIRRIVASTLTSLTVEPAFTTQVNINTKYAIGHIPWHVELGDWMFGEPFAHKALLSARPLLQTALSASHDLDFALDPTDIDDTATGYTYASGTVGAAMPPDKVMLPFVAGYTQRLLMLGRQGNAARPQVKALELEVAEMGRPSA